jgi:hypothetical protein
MRKAYKGCKIKRMLTKMRISHIGFAILILIISIVCIGSCQVTSTRRDIDELELIGPNEDGTGFVCAESGAKFMA